MKRLALFVGINNYPDSPLSCARADAEALYEEFKRRYDVAKLLVDGKASPRAILRALDALQKKAKAGDMLLFFFSGHGSDYAGEHILAVPDFDRHGDADGVEGISTADLRHATDVKGLHRLFVLDCCRTRLNDEELRLQAKAASKSPAYMASANRKAVILPTMLSSSGPGQYSYENHQTGHGFFTEAFIEAILDSGVSGFNAFRERIEIVMAGQRKRPGMQNPYFEGPIGSDLPFWPDWEECGVPLIDEAPPASLPARRRRRQRTPAQDPDEDLSDEPPEHCQLSDNGERWITEPGYEFVNKKSGDFRVRWVPGTPYSEEYSNVIASDKEGFWQPALGYVWEKTFTDNPHRSTKNLQVFWNEGVEHPEYPNVVAGEEEGKWNPAPGYKWTDPSDADDFSVQRKTLLERFFS